VNLLLDTQVVLWVAGDSKRLSARGRKLLSDPANTLCFSAASLWEITIKSTLGRADFQVELDNGFTELPITSQHTVSVEGLPDIHRDPFDRLLLAQAMCEGFTLVTADALLATYPGPIRKI
jgi:PIN domain nuclease of toxin-antitoxin system